MEKSIVLFGSGTRGEKFLIEYHNKIKIDEVFDNYRIGTFYGYQINKPYYRTDTFIIVAIEDAEIYAKIRMQLLELGYREFVDFIPCTIYKKKMALAYGNCHLNAVVEYLKRNKGFMDVYGFYPMVPIQCMNDTVHIESVISECDLFLHQSIRRDNNYGKEYASDAIIKHAKENVCILALPNLFGLPECFFPQMKHNEKLGGLTTKVLTHEDENIKRWRHNEVSIEEMEELILSGGIYSKDYILKLWDEFVIKLKKRECEWDIKISDYIFTHYKTEKIFCDRWHITTKLAREIANRVISRLGYEPNEEVVLPLLDGAEVFIYEDVKKALGLKFNETSIRNYTKQCRLESTDMSLRSYIEMSVQVYSLLDI